MNSINKALFTLIIFITCINIICETPEPYRSVNTLPLKLHGWFNDINKKHLKTLFEKHNPKIIVELGSWLGMSSIFIATNMPADCKLYSVDTWLGSEEHQKGEFSSFIPTLYQQFISNIKHSNLTNKIIPIRMSTQEAAQSLNIFPDLVYIDASHEENDVYNDIINWNTKLNHNGVICGDDWSWESVQRGVRKAAIELHKNINIDYPFWWLTSNTLS